jgi:hypothetical protein
MTEQEILREAADVLAREDRARADLRNVEAALRLLCRRYEEATGLRMLQPHHLRRLVNMSVAA